jgi:hypothetical protein
MTTPLRFPRVSDEILASADQFGLVVAGNVTMGIPKADALSYVSTYNEDPNAGFYEHDGRVVLSHHGSKVTLEKTEAEAVIELIKAAYP